MGALQKRSSRRSVKKKGNRGKKLDELLVMRAREALRTAREKTGGRIIVRKIKAHAGHAWNEMADALAAVGRTMATGARPVTAEVVDRLQRAIDAIGGDDLPDVECSGFSLA